METPPPIRRTIDTLPTIRKPPLHSNELWPDGWIDPAMRRVTAEHGRRGRHTGREKKEQKDLAHAVTVRTEVADRSALRANWIRRRPGARAPPAPPAEPNVAKRRDRRN